MFSPFWVSGIHVLMWGVSLKACTCKVGARSSRRSWLRGKEEEHLVGAHKVVGQHSTQGERERTSEVHRGPCRVVFVRWPISSVCHVMDWCGPRRCLWTPPPKTVLLFSRGCRVVVRSTPVPKTSGCPTLHVSFPQILPHRGSSLSDTCVSLFRLA